VKEVAVICIILAAKHDLDLLLCLPLPSPMSPHPTATLNRSSISVSQAISVLFVQQMSWIWITSSYRCLAMQAKSWEALCFDSLQIKSITRGHDAIRQLYMASSLSLRRHGTVQGMASRRHDIRAMIQHQPHKVCAHELCILGRRLCSSFIVAVIVQLSRLHVSRVDILADAAHSPWPACGSWIRRRRQDSSSISRMLIEGPRRYKCG
jgi:hypothetical protein